MNIHTNEITSRQTDMRINKKKKKKKKYKYLKRAYGLVFFNKIQFKKTIKSKNAKHTKHSKYLKDQAE